MKSTRVLIGLLTLALCMAMAFHATAQEKKFKTENIIFVMTDGLRWQEVFQGAEESLLPEAKSGIHPSRAAYWRDTGRTPGDPDALHLESHGKRRANFR